MKKNMFAAISLFALMLFTSSSAYSATIGLRPLESSILNSYGQIEVTEGDIFEIELYFDEIADIPEITDGGGVTGYTIDVLLDNALVDLQLVTKGSQYTFVDFTKTPGLLELRGYNFSSGIIDDHTLAILTLQCIGAGLTELLPIPHFDSSGNKPNFALQNGGDYSGEAIIFNGITIKQNSPVPIPGAFILLGSGLFGLLAIRRRKT